MIVLYAFSVGQTAGGVTGQGDDEIHPQIRVREDHPAAGRCLPDAVSFEIKYLDASVPFGTAEICPVVAHHVSGIDGEVPFREIIKLFVSGSSQVVHFGAVFQPDGDKTVERSRTDGQSAVGVCADSPSGNVSRMMFESAFAAMYSPGGMRVSPVSVWRTPMRAGRGSSGAIVKASH